MNWDECLEHAEVSDIGMRRTTNQDALMAVLASDVETWRQRGHLFIVADGMGAHAAGELASELAVSGIAHRYHKFAELSAPEALHRAIQETNSEVYQRGQANLDFHNMGTTTSALVLLPQGALVAHVGDSRVYRLRGSLLQQLTFDHSLVWELRASGHLSEDSELAQVVPKNIITRSLGPNAAIHPDFEGPFPVELGDVFLLCSDGLSGQITDEEIGPILAFFSPQEAAQALVDLANLRGGPDNITAIVVKVTGDLLATRNAATEPLRINRRKGIGAVHPVTWVVAGVGLLGALAMGLLGDGDYRWAAASAAIGLGALLVAVWQRWWAQPEGVSLGETRRLGKGPYTTVECPATAEFVTKLADMVRDLRRATDEEGWNVDVEKLDQHCVQAEQAAQAGEYRAALREYAVAISSMMSELRQQGRRGQGLSS